MTQANYFPAIRKLAEYEIWCNARIIQAAQALESVQLFQRFPFGLSLSGDPGMGTIHEALFHIVLVLQRWGGCVGPKIGCPPERDYDARMTIEAISQWNAKVAVTFLTATDASHEAGLLHLDRRIEQVFHLITHGTHHRTQLISMLRMLGKEPPFEAGDFAGWSRVNTASST